MIAAAKFSNDVYHINQNHETAEKYEEAAIQGLKNAGYRVTIPRVQVIRLLSQTNTALSPYEIHAKIIKEKGRIDIVSVYRVLATLQEIGFVFKVGISDGYFPNLNWSKSGNRSFVVIEKASQDVHRVTLTGSQLELIENAVRELGLQASEIRIEVVAENI